MEFKTESNLNLFIVISVALHLAVGSALLWFAPKKEPPRKETPYIVRIVPVEPPTPPLEERPPEVLGGETAHPSPKKAPPPKKALAAKPKAGPPPGPPVKKAPEEREPDTISKDAGGVVPPEVEGPKEKGPAPEAVAKGTEELTGKGKGETGKGKGEEGGARLFDPEVLSGVIAKKERPSERDGSITFDTSEIRYYSYMRKLKERIEAVWEYPRKAAEEGIYGDLVIRFVIKKDGSLGAVELVRTSGWRMLDQAAVAALRDGSPYWPLPDEWGTDSLTVTGHFIYTLYGYYYVR